MFTLKRFTLPLAALTAFAAGAVTISSSGLAQQTRPPATVEGAMLAAQTAQVAIAVFQMDSADLHALEDAVTDSRVPAGSAGTVQRIRIVAAATTWPDHIAPTAREFVAAATRLEAALRAEDAAAAAPEAKAAHDTGHTLSQLAYTWMAQQAGGSAMVADDHGDDHTHDAAADGESHSHDTFMQPAGVAAPTLRTELAIDPVGGYNLHIVTDNWTWKPELVNTDPVANEGHAHVYVDGVKTRVYEPWQHLKLDPGTHTIRVTLNVNNHAEIMAAGQVIETMTTVTVPATATTGDDHSHDADAGATMGHDMFIQPAGTPAPTVRLELAADPMGGYNLRVLTTNWTWKPELVNTDPVPNEGHAHVYVDGVKTRIYGPAQHLKLNPGTRTIRVTLNENNHAEIMADGEIVEATLTVDVPAATPAPMTQQ